MTSLGENDDVALIGTEDNLQSSYNKGPRPATDKSKPDPPPCPLRTPPPNHQAPKKHFC